MRLHANLDTRYGIVAETLDFRYNSAKEEVFELIDVYLKQEYVKIIN